MAAYANITKEYIQTVTLVVKEEWMHVSSTTTFSIWVMKAYIDIWIVTCIGASGQTVSICFRQDVTVFLIDAIKWHSKAIFSREGPHPSPGSSENGSVDTPEHFLNKSFASPSPHSHM